MYGNLHPCKREVGPNHTFPGDRQNFSIAFLSVALIGKATVSGIVTEVHDVIYAVLGNDFLQTSKQGEKWTEIAKLFNSRWNIPNNIRAINGKDILIQKPAYAGSHFHDYKENKSIIAPIVSRPDYECLYVDVGPNGRNPEEVPWAEALLNMH